MDHRDDARAAALLEGAQEGATAAVAPPSQQGWDDQRRRDEHDDEDQDDCGHGGVVPLHAASDTSSARNRGRRESVVDVDIRLWRYPFAPIVPTDEGESTEREGIRWRVCAAAPAGMARKSRAGRCSPAIVVMAGGRAASTPRPSW